MPGKKNVPIRDKVKDNVVVDPDSGCWNWQAAKNRHGYGVTCVNAKRTLAHRASYEAFIGAIPSGLCLDHLCRNPRCCNPDHLEAVSQKENVRRGIAADKKRNQTHCKHGHPLSGDNLHINVRGGRQCIICLRKSQLEWARRNFKPNPRKPKAHCPSGHDLSGDNLLVETVRQNGKYRTRRVCRACRRNHGKMYQRRKREAERLAGC